MIKTIYEQPRN